ncbi:MAG: hypothetical protein L0221_01385 [Chloroflexi bacterium]|nr:hypothetical protein [Chloroflexota bacterium]
MKDFGQLLLVLGAMSFLPTLLDYEWILSSWLGDLQAPVGIAAMAAGGLILGGAKLRQFRNAPPDDSPIANVLAQGPVVNTLASDHEASPDEPTS